MLCTYQGSYMTACGSVRKHELRMLGQNDKRHTVSAAASAYNLTSHTLIDFQFVP